MARSRLRRQRAKWANSRRRPRHGTCPRGLVKAANAIGFAFCGPIRRGKNISLSELFPRALFSPAAIGTSTERPPRAHKADDPPAR